jgi:hypothetical protein
MYLYIICMCIVICIYLHLHHPAFHAEAGAGGCRRVLDFLDGDALQFEGCLSWTPGVPVPNFQFLLESWYFLSRDPGSLFLIFLYRGALFAGMLADGRWQMADGRWLMLMADADVDC